jgi:DNA modification methylase
LICQPKIVYQPKIIHEDNRIALESFSNESFQMILTDPPYDMEISDKLWYHNKFVQLCCGTIVVFMPPENQWILPADEYLFWEKPISTKNTSKSYSRFVEMMFVYRMGEHKWNCARHWSQYTNVFKDLVDDTKAHKFRKPPSLIERLIRNHTSEGDAILDPFGGSLVVYDVAKRLNRICITIEKDVINA